MKRNRMPNIILTGQTKNGATVGVYYRPTDTYVLRCGCGKTFCLSHESTRVAIKRPGRMLHCYECSCKKRADNARKGMAMRQNKVKQ